VLRDTKKLILAVIHSFEKGDDSQDEPGSWQMRNYGALVSVNSIMEMWQDYHTNGVLPQAGGWLDQPLDLIVKIGAIDFLVNTWRNKTNEEYDWSGFSADQRHVITWYENEVSLNG
jgi:hypothetical protein